MLADQPRYESGKKKKKLNFDDWAEQAYKDQEK